MIVIGTLYCIEKLFLKLQSFSIYTCDVDQHHFILLNGIILRRVYIQDKSSYFL